MYADRPQQTDRNQSAQASGLEALHYGVDLDPMAVELAKVSVWLDSFTLGVPLSFLDHHLKCGNSLIGAKVGEADKLIKDGRCSLFSGNDIWAKVLLSAEGMIRVSKLIDVTPEQAHLSKEECKKSAMEIMPVKPLLNVYLSRQFSNPVRYDSNKMMIDKAMDFLYSDEAEKWVEDANKVHLTDEQKETFLLAEKDATDHKFFHWEFEFPDVFIDPKLASLKANPGFDVIVGNPPYGLITNEKVKKFCQTQFAVAEYQIDAYVVFMEKSLLLNRIGGALGVIIPTTYIGMHYFSKLRHFILTHTRPTKLVKLKFPVFSDATVESSIAILQTVNDENETNTLGQGFIYDSLSSFMLQNKSPIVFNTKDVLALEGNDFYFLQEEQNSQFLKRLHTISSKLGDICEMTTGVEPYQVGKGTPKQTRDVVQNRHFDASHKRDETYHQYLMGRDINRYGVAPATERWISYGDWLVEVRYSAPFFETAKILIRQTADSIIAAYDLKNLLRLIVYII